MFRYNLISVGNLKEERFLSMKNFRKELKLYGYEYSFPEFKELFDTILSGEFKEEFDKRFKHCLDTIFNDNVYDSEINPDYIYTASNVPPIKQRCLIITSCSDCPFLTLKFCNKLKRKLSMEDIPDDCPLPFYEQYMPPIG